MAIAAGPKETSVCRFEEEFACAKAPSTAAWRRVSQLMRRRGHDPAAEVNSGDVGVAPAYALHAK